jgi:outer membrane protein assembly factor BamB
MFRYNTQHTGRCPYDTSNNNGTLKWRYQIGTWTDSSPAIASDGTIYVGSYDNYLYAINPDGILKWRYQTGDHIYSSPAIASDGTIYVGSLDNYLYAINPDGTLKWRYQTGYWIWSSPAIASDGTIYVGSLDNYLYAINPDGTLKWRYQTGYRINSSPAIASDGTIYVGSQDNYLYAINPDGTLKWQYKTGFSIYWSSPTIASNGTIYVGSWDGYIYAINPDGTLKWRYQTGTWIESSPAIASDGTIYVESEDGYLYAIGGANQPSLDHFEFSPISSPQTANVPFNITITAKDQYGNTYTGFNSSVALSVNKGSITPTTTTNFVNGVLSNFQVTIPTANTGVTITATSQDGKTGTSNSFDVTPSPINSLTLHLVGNKFNLVSFPFSVNPSQIPNLDKAYTFDWYYYWTVWTPTGPQDFTTLEPGKGYWIKVTQDEDVTLTGTPVSSSVTVSVTPGKFNLLGNPFNTPILLSDLNAANGNHIIRVYTFDWSNFWDPINPLEFSSTYLDPGKGCWIQLDSNASTSFTFNP